MIMGHFIHQGIVLVEQRMGLPTIQIVEESVYILMTIIIGFLRIRKIVM